MYVRRNNVKYLYRLLGSKLTTKKKVVGVFSSMKNSGLCGAAVKLNKGVGCIRNGTENTTKNVNSLKSWYTTFGILSSVLVHPVK